MRWRMLAGSIRVEVRGIGSLSDVELPIRKLLGRSSVVLVLLLFDEEREGEGEMRSWAAVLWRCRARVMAVQIRAPRVAMVDFQYMIEEDPVGGVQVRLISNREEEVMWKSLTVISGRSGMNVGYGIVVSGSVTSYCGILFRVTGSIGLEG